MSLSAVTVHQQTRMKAFVARIVPYVGMFILALLLWLPFGFKDIGLIEELPINQQFDAGHLTFFITPDSVMAGSRSRPLQMVFFSASYALAPNSYLFYNLFTMLFFFGKLVVTYGLVLQFLPGKKLLAFIVGLLFMLYPADTGLFTLRVIHIHSATLAYLLALYLLIVFYKRRGTKSWLAILGAVLFLIFSIGQYQIALAAAVVTPLALLYFGWPNRRFLISSAIWYAALAAVVLYEVWAGKQPGPASYEALIMPTSTFTFAAVKSMLSAVLVGYQRQMMSWVAAFSQFKYLAFFWPYILFGLMMTAGLGWWFTRRPAGENPSQPVSWRRYAVLLLAGIVLFPLGIGTYLPLPYYRFNEFRIYFLAMLGPALVLALVLYLISRRVSQRYREPLFLILALPFVGLGFLSLLQQHQYYVNFSLDEQNILQQVVAQAPQIKPSTALVMLDNGGQFNKNYVFYNGIYLPEAIHYLYQDTTLEAHRCPVYNGTAQTEICQFERDELRINQFPTSVTLPYDRVLLFTTDNNGQVHLMSAAEAAAAYPVVGYAPESLIVSQNPPHRARTLFSCVPASSCYRGQPIPSLPGSSFDLPHNGDIGFGWREPEFDESGEMFQWTVSSISTIDLNLSDQADLALEFKVLHWVSESVIDSLKLTINGQDIPLTFSPSSPTGRIYRGIIPRQILTGRPSRTQLVFKVTGMTAAPNAPEVQLGFAINWLHIRPA